ncbi:ParB family protein [Pseudomonas sp. KCJK9044]|uniref:ParB family protein n=1 Tax=Pseudomonas sp. KCJK9044 TaxID=3344562 RepID=UPI003905F11E
MKPPTSEDITRQLQQAHFPQKHDRDLAMAPVGDTPMVVTLEQLRPYELNPRVVRNPLYDDIKASIRERGLDQPPAITRRPNDRHFIIRNGGNTRLSILGELWQETREERFFRIHCLFRPWQSESHALLGHHLKVHQLQVVMKPESPGGKTQFKLVLQLPGGGAPSAILSEGEQRAIAIASFLAEIKLGKGRGGIVLDDPVSSLDHCRRWEVAERLARESLNRQVIVFTHDIYFLCILEQKLEELGGALTKNYIRRTAQGYGVHSQDLPFDVLGTKDRLGRLRQELVAIRQALKAGEEDEHRRLTSACYGRLRLAWERCIEEVLLNGAVQRFGEGVSTQRLKSVVVTDDDYREVESGMSKSSKFEHDAATPVGRLPMPEPDELEQDIEKLSTWRGSLDKRLRETAKARG